MKVYMTPYPEKLNESGIKRVAEAYVKYLPEFGIEFVDSDTTADLISSHAGSYPAPTVSHVHGLYWSADFPVVDDWEWKINEQVINAVRKSKEITVPSAWVAETFQRDMRFSPHVIPHGIEWQEWQHTYENEGYVLWNKNRTGDVCDVSPLVNLSNSFPDNVFVSTFKPINTEDNIKMLEHAGMTPYHRMRRIIQGAGVYLATTKETFGIGTLEAMAAGVPVLGYAWGGNVDLVKHGINGYLAKPGSIEDLIEGLHYCFKYHDILGANGRELAKKWTWQNACEMVYQVYQKALVEEAPSVSVVIPVYNKPVEQIKRAVDSCLNQTLKPFEIKIVNDGSDDSFNYPDMIDEHYDSIVGYFYQGNQGVASARNNGIVWTDSKYILCLDADDWIEPDFLQVCVNALESDRSLGIAYTGLKQHNQDGSSVISPWPGEFNAYKQLENPKLNQVPTACVFRREAWQRVGGYKSRYCPNGAGSEDAALWSAICSIGYGAKQVTRRPQFNYSAGGATSSNYNEVDWLQMSPWATDKQHPFASVIPAKYYSHPVRQYDEPLISIIIPVGPGHEKMVQNALDSLEMQHFRKWEVIVVWDSEIDIPERLFKAYPYPIFLDTGSFFNQWTQKEDGGKDKLIRQERIGGGQHGAGFARNRGIEIARGKFLFFLDADDVLSDPDAFDIMIKEWNIHSKAIYSDYVIKASWGDEETARAKAASSSVPGKYYEFKARTQQSIIGYTSMDFDCQLAQRQPELMPNGEYYAILNPVLVPRKWIVDAGMYDENLTAWEDVELFWRMSKLGYCFHRVQKELLLYNLDSGNRRESSFVTDRTGRQNYKNLLEYIIGKHKDLKTMPCCPGKTQEVIQTVSDSDYVEIEFWPPNMQYGQSWGKSLRSPTGKMLGTKIVDYGRFRRVGDRFLVHRDDQAAKPDVFRLAISTPAIEVPEESIPTPEPVAISEVSISESVTITYAFDEFSFTQMMEFVKDPKQDNVSLIQALDYEQANRNRKRVINTIKRHPNY